MEEHKPQLYFLKIWCLDSSGQMMLLYCMKVHINKIITSLSNILNHMQTADNTMWARWTYIICVRVRNSVSMETDQEDTGDACLLHSAPVNGDRSQHEDISLLYFPFLSSCLHTSSPLNFSLHHILFWSFHLTYSGPISLNSPACQG